MGRTLGAAKLSNARFTRKDKDWISLRKRLRLGPDTASAFVAALQCDCAFLEAHGIMDYSLLLGVRKRASSVAAAPSAWWLWSGVVRAFRAVAGTSTAPDPCTVSAPERRNAFKSCATGFKGATGERFVVGIIDYLQR